MPCRNKGRRESAVCLNISLWVVEYIEIKETFTINIFSVSSMYFVVVRPPFHQDLRQQDDVGSG